MLIIQDDVTGSQIRALLEFHFTSMLANSPKGSCHFLNFDGLKSPGVTFWSVWDFGDFGRKKFLDPDLSRQTVIRMPNE